MLLSLFTGCESEAEKIKKERVQAEIIQKQKIREELGEPITTEIMTVGSQIATESDKRIFSNCKAWIHKEKSQLTIKFDTKDLTSDDHPNVIAGHLLIRMFDANGNHVNNIITKELYTFRKSKNNYLSMGNNDGPLSNAIVLNDNENSLQFFINQRDATIIRSLEFGFLYP